MAGIIFVSSDHGGFYLKEQICSFLKNDKYDFIDLGTNSAESVDYPDYSNILALKLKNNKNSTGILFCGTGIGMSIAANRHEHIRAALCTDTNMASLSRKHNDSNVIVIGGRTTSTNLAKEMIKTFLSTKFEQGRHLFRVNKLGRHNK